MSTYANVLVEGGEFSVRSDGWDKETIRNCVREYIAGIKGKVKPDYLLKAVLDAITAGIISVMNNPGEEGSEQPFVHYNPHPPHLR